MDINSLIAYAKEHDASDIHVSSEHPPMIRTMGDISYLNVNKLTAEDVRKMLTSLLTPDQMKRFNEDLELDSSIEINQARYRINVFMTHNGPAFAMRIIAEKIRSLGELHIPSVVERFARLNKGLILVTGPCGSGKSTTLAGIINYINQNYSKHIITIEDPIEYKFASQKCLVNQREISTHAHSFARALKSALREDPDIIMIGELRDLETIQLALTAAETGHLVFSTLHTSSAPKTIDRIIDVFPSGVQPLVRTMLSSSLEGTISQILLPKVDGTEMIAAFEIMINTPGIRNLIRDNKIHQIGSLMEIGSKQGMISMQQYIKKLQTDGIISQDIALRSVYEILELEKQNKEDNDVLSSYKDSNSF